MVRDTLEKNRLEFAKSLEDRAIYGNGFCRIEKDGSIKHIPIYQVIVNFKKGGGTWYATH